MTDRAEFCRWCGKQLPREGRKDRTTCSRACRQAHQRFRVAPAASAAGAQPLRFGYADPPYPGLAKRYYSHDPNCAEVDHAALIADLMARFPDGWALSTSAQAMREVLVLCPPGVRVAIWVKGSRAGESYRARNAYEPVILWGGRPRKMGPTEELDDVLLWGGRQHSHPDALVGMKPAPFAEWVFRQLGALAGDYLTDVFPGSGAMMRAWVAYGGRDPNEQETTANPRLPFEDIVTAPPAPRNRVGSRLEEAAERIRSSSTSDEYRGICGICGAASTEVIDEAGEVLAMRCSSCPAHWEREDWKPSQAAAPDDSSQPAGTTRPQLTLIEGGMTNDPHPDRQG